MPTNNNFVITIIGLGPRGINILERLTACLHHQQIRQNIEVHIVEPQKPGQGVHCINQPDYLLLNTVASQITLFTDETVISAGEKLPGPTLYEWAVQYSNYENIQPNSYLPRRMFGEYLNWTYHYLVKHLKGLAEVELHKNYAIDIIPNSDTTYQIILDNQNTIETDALFMTTGHSANKPSQKDNERELFVQKNQDKNPLLQYIRCAATPMYQQLADIPSHATILIEGMGLTANDLVASLTVGRGGQFHRANDSKELFYVPSGSEPSIILYSRNGIPLGARAENQKGASGQYQGHYLTFEAIEALKKQKAPHKLDFYKDVFPLLLKDMSHVYYITYAKKIYGDALANLLDDVMLYLSQDEILRILSKNTKNIPAFDWNMLQDPIPNEVLSNRHQFNQWLIGYLQQDLLNARQGNLSNPVKAACDVLRDLRDVIRSAVDFGRLTPDSQKWFQTEFIPVMNRLAVGPPKERLEEWLALIKSGYMKVDFGPDCDLIMSSDSGKFLLKSKYFQGYSCSTDILIQARIPKSVPETDRSQLTQNLLRRGLIRPYENDGFSVGGIEVDHDLYVVNQHGDSMPNFWALGTISEGAKFYTYIVPRPYVNSTALVDAGQCVTTLFEKLTQQTHMSQQNLSYVD